MSYYIKVKEVLLTGKLFYSKECRHHVISGQWEHESATNCTPLHFKLVHCPWPNRGCQDQTLLPRKGGTFKEHTFNGDFAVEIVGPKYENEIEEVKETGVLIKFTKEKGKRQETYTLSGKGVNRFGDFILVGKATKNECVYTIKMTKKYV